MNQLPPIPFLFVRHGQTDWNKEHRIMGHRDIPLNQEGRTQAYALHEILQGQNIRQIFYSPLSRAQETAHIINEILNVPMHPLNELKEWHWGELEGVVHDKECKGTALYREKTLLEWAKDPHAIKAETEDSFLDRIEKGVNNVLLNNSLSLVVSHGGVFWGLCKLLNCPYESLDNCLPLMFKPVYLGEKDSNYAWEVRSLKQLGGYRVRA